MKEAQDIIKNGDSHTNGGFNCRVSGGDSSENLQGARGEIYSRRFAGWELADGMIMEGKIFSIMFPTIFNESPTWQKARVQKDGDAWCCVGYTFENLQESDNYAFGDTRSEAIENYGNLMKKRNKDSGFVPNTTPWRN
ncbi:MAG: hypothetical protein COA78_22165 [Blastopirellula sp.]|nr:MAG: hypothetical protein COA78_22165 [Blastopirellula sp.]